MSQKLYVGGIAFTTTSEFGSRSFFNRSRLPINNFESTGL